MVFPFDVVASCKSEGARFSLNIEKGVSYSKPLLL